MPRRRLGRLTTRRRHGVTMELLTEALGRKVTELVAIDAAQQSAIPEEGISAVSADVNQVEARHDER